MLRRCVGAVIAFGCIVAEFAGSSAAQQPAADRANLPKYGLTKLDVGPGDWPQLGGTSLRNNALQGRNIPARFTVPDDYDPTVKPHNDKWSVPIGSTTYGAPVVAGGRVFVGTNNGARHVARFPDNIDLSCLIAFNASDGKFLWQHSTPKHPQGRLHDWPMEGNHSVPLVDGNRLWYVTNLAEIVCLDVEGFYDGENDGPFKDEEVAAAGEADVVWKFNLIEKLGVHPHERSTCSFTCAEEVLLVNTGNGVDNSEINLPAPEAPSFLALDRRTAQVLWTDNSPGGNILYTQRSSPAYAVLGGKPQMIVGGGDGWLYSFDPRGDGRGKPRLWWKFDANPKSAKLLHFGRGTRNEVFAAPVIYDGKVYCSTGTDPVFGVGQGVLWCVDPTKRFDGGDVSAELVIDAEGKPAPLPRGKPVHEAPGLRAIPNPQSAVAWRYQSWKQPDGRPAPLEQTMHRSCSPVVAADGLVYIPDFGGILHCVDARTGIPYWTHDVFAAACGWSYGPLLVDGKLFVPAEDKMLVFAHGKIKQLLAENEIGNSSSTAPIVAGNILYFATRTHLYAIAAAGH